jgi:hypothetical protein
LACYGNHGPYFAAVWNPFQILTNSLTQILTLVKIDLIISLGKQIFLGCFQMLSTRTGLSWLGLKSTLFENIADINLVSLGSQERQSIFGLISSALFITLLPYQGLAL